jgi:hypothetical protein
VLCRQALDGNLEVIINFVELELDALDICARIGACSHTAGPPRRASSTALLCSAAQDIVAFVQQLRIEGEGDPSIRALVHALADSLPPAAGAAAGVAVERRLAEVLAWTADGADAFEAARRLGLCRAFETRRPPMLSLRGRRPTARRFPRGAICDACEASAACDALPFPLSALCADAIAAARCVVPAGSPDFCARAGLCGGAATAVRTRGSRPGPDRACEVAQDALNYVALLAAQGLGEQALAERLSSVCDGLPFPAGTVCGRFIGGSLREVVAALRAGEGALEVAAALGLCSARAPRRRARALMVLPRRAPADVLCDACQDAVALIERLAIEGFIESDIEALVASMCNALPFPVSAWCTSIVDEKVEEIIAMIEQGIEALDICRVIGICATHKTGAPVAKAGAPKGKAILRRIPGDVFCDVCVEVVDYVAELILNGTVEPEIKALVEKLCDRLEWPVSSLCISFVDGYIDEIIAYIEAGVSDICGVIGLCTNPPPREYNKLMQIRAKGTARRPHVRPVK